VIVIAILMKLHSFSARTITTRNHHKHFLCSEVVLPAKVMGESEIASKSDVISLDQGTDASGRRQVALQPPYSCSGGKQMTV